MQKEIQDLKDNQQDSSGDDKRKKRQPRKRVDTSKYCWTHGAWNHMENIAGGRQTATKTPQFSKIAWVGVTIVVHVPNETEVRSFLCYIIIVLN